MLHKIDTRFASEFEGLSCTRDLLDSIVRARLKQLPNVEVLHSCEVTSLVGKPEGVEGVRLRLRGERMAFVDDCCGILGHFAECAGCGWKRARRPSK